MTSEGQHAGQPAEATSGGAAEQFRPDDFPPDSDGQRFTPPTTPGQQSTGPHSYAPPPPATPNGGSPFVVPAVPPAGHQFPAAPATRFGAPPAGSARVPQPDPSAWAPPVAESDNAHPYQNQDFHGFAPGSPTRASAGATQGNGPDPAGDRAPGISAFGDQRIRVPGATLTGLPDAPAPIHDARDEGGALPRRTPGSTASANQPTGGSLFSPTTPPAAQPPGSGSFAPSAPSGAPGDAPFGTAMGGRAAAVPPSDGPFAPPAAGTPSSGGAFAPSSFGGSYPPPASDSPYAPPAPGGQFTAPSSGGPYTPASSDSPYAPPSPDGPFASPSSGSAFSPPSSGGPFTPASSGDSFSPSTSGGPFTSPSSGDSFAPSAPGSPFSPPSSGGPFSPPSSGDVSGGPAQGATFGSSRDDQAGGPTPRHPFGDRPTPAGDGQPFTPPHYGTAPSSGGTYGRPADQSAHSDGSPFETPAPFGDRPTSFPPEDAGPLSFGGTPPPSFGGTPPPSFGGTPLPAEDRFGGPDANQPPFGGTPDSAPSRFGAPDANQAPFSGATDATPAPFGGPDASLRPSPFSGDSGGPDDEHHPYASSGAEPDQSSAASQSPFGGGQDDPQGIYQRSTPPAEAFSPPAQGNPFGGGANSFAQRVPGASLAGIGGSAPVAAEPRNAAVPQPRDSAESSASATSAPPATGTARPVTASASVPMASRVTPVDPDELPPTPAVPQARVYGRAASPVDEPAAGAEPQDDNPSGAWPWDAQRQQAEAEQSSDSPFPRGVDDQGNGARASARVAPPEAPPGAAPFSEFTTDVSGRSRTPQAGTPDRGQAPEADLPGRVPANKMTGFGRTPDSDLPTRAPATEMTGFGRAPDANAPGFGRTPDPDVSGFGRSPAHDGRSPAHDGPPAHDVPNGGLSETGRGQTPQADMPSFGRAPENDMPGRGPAQEPDMSGFGPRPRDTMSGFGPAPDMPGFGRTPDNTVPGRGRTPELGGRAPELANQPGPGPEAHAARTTPPDQYGENTTDISGRGPDQQPYVPAPALPSMHASQPLQDGFPHPDQPAPPGIEGDRPRLGGVFPGPASRATVTPPPGPEETASWPNRTDAPADADQGRFDQFKADTVVSEAVKADPPKPETPHVRMLPLLIWVIIGGALLVGLAFGVVYLISGDSNAGMQVSAGECVKKDGDAAVKASCTDADAFQVASIAATRDQCSDPGQPYVLNPTSDGRTQVLCLKPRS